LHSAAHLNAYWRRPFPCSQDRGNINSPRAISKTCLSSKGFVHSPHSHLPQLFACTYNVNTQLSRLIKVLYSTQTRQRFNELAMTLTATYLFPLHLLYSLSAGLGPPLPPYLTLSLLSLVEGAPGFSPPC
jgi:hypothetical protein